MSEVAYKLLTRADWDDARAAGAYVGSAVDRADGYIHMSTGAQLAATAAKHYAGQAALVLVTIDLAALGDALKWEPSRGGDLFPHLYAPLPTGAARAERGLSVDGGGLMRFDDGAVGWP
jgi:uncharacterized protein (DUF952 family)